MMSQKVLLGSSCEVINDTTHKSTCDVFDDIISLVVTAVSGFEADLVRGSQRRFEPALQEHAQILLHVLWEGPTRAAHRQHAQDHASLLLLGLMEV